jgi:hypothetical protein
MLNGLNEYRSYNRRYNNSFDGDDQLSELNDGITDITEENIQLRNRLHNMRESMKDEDPGADKTGE